MSHPAKGQTCPPSDFYPFPTVSVLLSRSSAQLEILLDMIGHKPFDRLSPAESRLLETNIFFLLEAVIEQLGLVAYNLPENALETAAVHPRCPVLSGQNFEGVDHA